MQSTQNDKSTTVKRRPWNRGRLAAHIFGAVSAFDLFVADIMLDDLSRLVWVSTFAAVPGERIAATLDAPQAMRDLAAELDGHPVECVNQAISFARATLWEMARRAPPAVH